MAYTVPAGSVLELVLQGTVCGQTTLSIFHWKIQDQYGDGKELANEFLDFVLAAGGGTLSERYLGCCANNFSLVGASAQWIAAIRYARIIRGLTGRPGTVANPCTASNVSAAITKRCDEAGRGNVGTLHMPGVAATDYSDGLLTDTAIARYNTLASDLDDTISTDSNTWIPILFKKGLPANGPTITSASTQRTLRIMRRRTVGLGI